MVRLKWHAKDVGAINRPFQAKIEACNSRAVIYRHLGRLGLLGGQHPPHPNQGSLSLNKRDGM